MRWNDKTITKFNTFMQNAKSNKIYNDVIISLFKRNEDGTTKEAKHRGYWILCNNRHL